MQPFFVLLLACLGCLVSLTMSAQTIIAVTGATGRLGRSAVHQLVQDGYQVRCLVRRQPPATVSHPQGEMTLSNSSAEVLAWLNWLPEVEVVVGDVTDRQAVAKLLRGCSACLALHGARRTRKISDLWNDPLKDPSHSKYVNCEAIQHLIDGSKASGTCKRIVRITGKGETPWSIFSILINGLGSMAKAWNYEGEQVLRATKDVDYTIIRPGVMGRQETVPPKSLVLADNGGDLKVSSISYSAVADLCVESLAYPNAARATLCAMTVPEGEGADNWKALLTNVRPDVREFRTDLMRDNVLAVRTGFAALTALASLLVIGIASVLSRLVHAGLQAINSYV